MTLKQALNIVLELAENNLLTEEYIGNDPNLLKDAKRQEQALQKVYKLLGMI